MNEKDTKQQLIAQGKTYASLVRGANVLLDGRIVWTERLLLKIVKRLYSGRLRDLVMILPDEAVDEVLIDKELPSS